MTNTQIVQDGLKFYIEKTTFDIATYKIERIDVSHHFQNAYYKAATKRAKATKTINRFTELAKVFNEVIKSIGVSVKQAVENLQKAFAEIEKARLAPKNKPR